MEKIKIILTRIWFAIVGIFYMTTNGVTAGFLGYYLYTIIPKLIFHYKSGDNDKLTFYVILALILGKIVFNLTLNFITATKTFISAITK